MTSEYSFNANIRGSVTCGNITCTSVSCTVPASQISGNLPASQISAGALNIGTGNGNALTCGPIVCNSIGIGTTTPEAPLEIETSIQHGSVTYAFLQYSTPITGTGSGSQPLSIKCSQSILAGGPYLTTSDKRIKENITDMCNLNPMNMIKHIEPVRYTYKDMVQKGTLEEYGFIAQNIKEVIPRAVSITTNYIPNIMDFSVITILGSRYFIKLNTKSTSIIDIDDNVKIKTFEDSTEIIFTLIEIVDNSTIEVFPVENTSILDGSVLFVYGQYVNDLQILDKTPIIALNSACIKELCKMVSSQSVEIEELKTKIDFLMTKVDK